MQKTAIIIPCYNEENRIDKGKIISLIEKSEVTIYLANDGSTDQTLELLESISKESHNRIKVLNYEKNSGKAAVIYNSVNRLYKSHEFDYIGYFDADFSTPVSEIIRMLEFVKVNRTDFILGSRVKLLNSNIDRKLYRHIIGRIIITILNFKFKLAIYDTQCGAKIFSNKILENAFSKPFYTSWLFDIEIFIRLKKAHLLNGGCEFPLTQWKDVEGSKLGFKTGFKILKEMYLLNKNYR